jgi:hypothetical protein
VAYLRSPEQRLHRHEKRALALLVGAKEFVRWPVVLIISLLFLHSFYMGAVLHPVYETDEALPKHLFWHTLLANYGGYDSHALDALGLQGPPADGDAIGWNTARIYALKSRLASSPDALNATLTKYALRIVFHDKLMRRLYLGYVVRHPLRVLNVYLIAKPRDILQAYATGAATAFQPGLIAMGYALCAGFILLLILLPWTVAQAWSMLLVLGTMAATIAIPQVAGAPNPLLYLADMFIVWPIAMFMGVPLLIAIAVRRLSAHPSRKFAMGYIRRRRP